MKLTQKDKTFLDTLARLIEEKQLRIDVRNDGISRFILRQNYGDKIEQAFGMTRQGVRWRFQRLFNHIYVEAYERILWMESSFGRELREHAVAIAQERAAIRRRILEQERRCIPLHRGKSKHDEH
ncbi:MAG: hypothetical protein HUU46_07580 [Candidatus Hydrogenedentes bacterium]|nr:hypothetical protein [Candidatus Hydrogenedentota bacterium]